MASRELVVGDEYCAEISQYLVEQGRRLEQLISSYIQILNTARENAITGGEVADALSRYIEYVNRLSNRFGIVSPELKTQVSNFLEAIDEADRYLF